MLATDTPDDFINKLSAVQNKYIKTGALTDDDLLTEAIVKVPKDYNKSLVAGAVARLGNAITLEDLREVMSQQYRIKVNTIIDAEDNDDKAALAAAEDLVCYNCGEVGRKAAQCKKPNRRTSTPGVTNPSPRVNATTAVKLGTRSSTAGKSKAMQTRDPRIGNPGQKLVML